MLRSGDKLVPMIVFNIKENQTNNKKLEKCQLEKKLLLLIKMNRMMRRQWNFG